ncbi:MAG: hypothetical protein IKW51_09785 [Bacteroidales bacterium]|nr:hypothetical protein [Bacteroidales bacterium]
MQFFIISSRTVWGGGVEHDEDEYGDYKYVGRTKDYYNEEYDEDSLYDNTWTWTYSNDINDVDFAGEIYELTPEDSKELDYWLRSRRMNNYQRQHSFNPRTSTPEEMYQYLIKYGKRVK